MVENNNDFNYSYFKIINEYKNFIWDLSLETKGTLEYILNFFKSKYLQHVTNIDHRKCIFTDHR